MDSRTAKEPPCYIVGLPESPGEADLARQKFERLSGELTKVLPTIEEIRAVVKSGKAAEGGHPRYEVSVEVYTPTERHAFSETGYSILKIIDIMEPRMKKLLSSKQSKVTARGGASRRKVP